MNYNSFEFDKVETDKSKASTTPHLNHLGTSIAFAFRTLEVALILILFSWIFTRVPLAVKLSGEILQQLAGSPLFIFALCNGIIFAIVAKSSEIKRYVDEQVVRITAVDFDDNDRDDFNTERNGEIVVYEEDKWIISEGIMNTCGVKTVTCDDDMAESSCTDYEKKKENDKKSRVYRRSKSEKLNTRKSTSKKVLKRSETEKCGKDMAKAAEEVAATEEEEMSNEEFQRTIDEFIAKQLKFRRQESTCMSMAIVIQN
ncbi:hypothetical protein ACFE04_001494 [Oxalis oulophora]